MVDDWSAWLGKIELATAVEDEFGISISDDEIDASDTVDALAKVVQRKKPESGVPVDTILALAISTLGHSATYSKPAMQPTSSLREVFAKYGRADA